MSNGVEEIYEEDFDSDGGHILEEDAAERGVNECSDSCKTDANANVANTSTVEPSINIPGRNEVALYEDLPR
jgi:hypothetical protein